MTIKRKGGENYLTLTIASLLEHMFLSDQERVHILIGNMDPYSSVHSEAYRFMPIMDVYTHYRTQYISVKEAEKQLNINIEPIQDDEIQLNINIEPIQQDDEMQSKLDNLYRKQINDYIYILEKCQSLSEYVLILEDDVYAAQDFYFKIMEITNELKHKDDWIFLKLFFMEDFLGWSNDDFVFEFGVVVIFGVIAYVACKKLKIKNWWVVFIVGNAGFVGFGTLQLIGKQNIFTLLPSGLSVIEYTCCSPAHLYKSSKIPDLIKYLKLQATKKSEKVKEVDLHLDDYAKKRKFKEICLFPKCVSTYWSENDDESSFCVE